jgi:hypothetical protein
MFCPPHAYFLTYAHKIEKEEGEKLTNVVVM